MADKFDKKELLNWIETQPELKFIRDKASRTFRLFVHILSQLVWKITYKS